MDLFVINRHGEEKPKSTSESEQAKLDKVLRRIERKKQQRIRQREREKELKSQKSQTIDENRVNSEKTHQEDDNWKEFVEKINVSEVTEEVKPNHNFTILGIETGSKKAKTERVLPQWLAKPTLVSSDLQNLTIKASKFHYLDKDLRLKLKRNGIKYLFPIQAQVIPYILKSCDHKNIMIPRDVCVSAPTGSGKTLAFVLPIIQTLKQHTVCKIRALIVLPTQELAEQVFKTFKIYTEGTNLETGLISGKHLFNLEQKQLVYFNEAFGYLSKIDILVCTAGRLVSHLKSTEGFDLQFLEFLVIDEADRVLESVQDDWLYHLEKHISKDNFTIQNRKILNLDSLEKQISPQKLLFSATLTQDPEKIEKLALFQPKLFSSVVKSEEISKYTTPKELTEKYIVCSKNLKPLALYSFIKKENLTKTIVFTHSVETTHRLKILLQSLFKSKRKIEEISSNLKGKSRDNLIENFTKGEIDILICTDFLARGIDLAGVQCVVSYSAPKYLKTYIHRVGRTARAGEFGLAVTILHHEQLNPFKVLLNQMKKDIEEIKTEENFEDLEKKYEKALNKLKEIITNEEKSGLNKVISKKKALKKVKIQK